MCTALAEEGTRYCPAHRGGIERVGKTQPRVKHDLDLDVLPWAEDDAAALNRNDRQRRVKQER